jgi:hypothetical protein
MRHLRPLPFVAGLTLLVAAIVSLGIVGPRILETRTYMSPPAGGGGGIEGASIEAALSLPATGMAVGAVVVAIAGLVLMVESVVRMQKGSN